MDFARIREVAPMLLVVTMSTVIVSGVLAKDPATTKESTTQKGAPKGVRCCGLLLRTNFGHPERMSELSIQPDTVMTNCIDSGKTKGLVEAFDAYFQTVESEFGDAEQRDIVRARLNQVFRSVVKDPARSAQLLEGYRKFYFASVLSSKGLSGRAIEEIKQARGCFLRAAPADSFCLMTLELYLSSTLSETGDAAEAVAISQGVVTRARAVFTKSDEFVGLALAGLAKAQLADGKASLAEASLRESMGILANSLEIQPNVYLMNCNILAESLISQSKNAEAAELMAYLEPQMRTLFQDQRVPPVFNAVMMRAKALVALEKFDDAETVLGKYPELMLSFREPGVPGRDLLQVYISLLEKTGREAQAAPARKCVARIDAKLASANRR